MEIRTLWNILIKVLGFWLAFDSIYVLPQVVYTFPYFMGSANDTLVYIGIFTVCAIIYVGIIRLLLFRTYTIIDKLKLASSITEERVSLNLDAYKVLSVSIIVISGITFIDSVPHFIRTLIEFFKQGRLLKDYADTGWIVFYGFKSLLAYLAVTNHKTIATFILRKSA